MLEQLDFNSNLSRENKCNEEVYMRVMLIEQYGMLHIIRLPDVKEGRYRFRNDTGEGSSLPIYIEGNNNCWIAHVGKNAVFRSVDGQEINERVLCDKMLEKIYFHGNTYVLFAEIERGGDQQFLPYYLDEQMEYMIGRRSDCQICYPCETVSRNHALLQKRGEFWYIIDNDSANGVYFNGRRVKSARLHNGDTVFIMGLYLLTALYNFLLFFNKKTYNHFLLLYNISANKILQ